jgi:cell division protein FtsZ
VANEKTTFADAFAMADQVLCSGIACITDLMVKKGLVNLDFADVYSIMSEMGTAMIGTGEATGEGRALRAAEAAIANPLLSDTSIKSARGLLISITGGEGLTLYQVDEAASRIREEVDEEANIIVGATFEPSLCEAVRVSVVATGIDQASNIRVERMSAQSQAEPAPYSSIMPPLSAEPLLAPIIPFPEPAERRRFLAEETDIWPATRRQSLRERLGKASSEKAVPRASGWR